MSFEGIPGMMSAVNDFRTARNQAVLKELIARFTGESIELLSYEEVHQKLRMMGGAERGLQDIPTEAIIGSVGRYSDFTRDFLPRGNVDEKRWNWVKNAMESGLGLPPIEVYQIGEAYFVKDGNHRVSVARQMGTASIQAYVTEIRTRVPLTLDTRPDDLIVKAEYVVFLEHTHLDVLRPDANLNLTAPGQYPILEEHIAVHQYYMGMDEGHEITYEAAVADWYDTVYLPVIRLVREMGILRDFPNRTEADFYIWVARHRADLEQSLGWEVKTENALNDLAQKLQPSAEGLWTRLGAVLMNILSLGRLEPGPPAGQWRNRNITIHREDRIFNEILVPVDGQDSGWHALEQAMVIARREGARLLGLHIVAFAEQVTGQPALACQAEFNRRCAEANLPGRLVIVVGEIADEICNRARWTDLVVTNLAHPPEAKILSRLESGFRDMIERCPGPLLAAPQTATELTHPLLAYDGSPKAREALYVATYLAGQWCIPLTVLEVMEAADNVPAYLPEAQDYLEQHHISAAYVSDAGPVGETILQVAGTRGCDFLILGGYGRNPVLELLLGSTVDYILRKSAKPMLICR